MKSVLQPLNLAAAALFAFLYAPLVVVILYSFNAARFGAGWAGFTMRWYGELLHNSAALSAVKNTLTLGILSTGISVLLGTMLGYGLSRFHVPGQRIFSRLLYLPVFIPDIILGIGFLMFYSLVRDRFGILELGLPTMILSHVTFQIPFVAIVVRARLAGLDPVLEEAARDLGASEWQAFYHVTLPLLVPGILAASMLAFTLSLDDFVVSFFTCGPGSTTLPILIYSSVKRGLTPDINVLSTLMVLASIVGTALFTLAQRARKI